MGALRLLDQSGDTKHEWDPSKPAEVEAAAELFTLYRQRGYIAARMENDAAGEVINEFDPRAGTIIFHPQMQGG